MSWVYALDCTFALSSKKTMDERVKEYEELEGGREDGRGVDKVEVGQKE